jgi:hypothetical protein
VLLAAGVGTTVSDDDAIDLVAGGDGRDWFPAGGDTDSLPDPVRRGRDRETRTERVV